MNNPEESTDDSPSLEASRKILRETSQKDFDGHTSFQNMTLEERIQWASLSAMAVWAIKNQAQETE